MHKVWRLRAFTAEFAETVRSFYTASYQGQIQAQFSGYDSFEAMVRSTPGNWFILTRGGYMDFQDPDRFILGWVAPWAIPCSARCAYDQLDGSFRVSKPHVYSIRMAIANNESFPLGFCIAPSELVELYSTFFDQLINLRARERHIYGKPLVRDRGAALMSYGRRSSHDLPCVWHLSANYGSKKWSATIVRRIAFATCEVDFLEQMSRILDDLTVFAEHGKLKQGMFDRFSAEFGIVSEGRTFRFDQKRAGVRAILVVSD
jgi:hypothetical protein